ncbi:hypothetical protein EUA04_22605 [Mycolicibacterium obuense]|uniref:34 kDa antigenic protein n=2 Tax=Mycolicibacterium obuense TaxID=1807 RepID=A0A0M2K046_9MYCO|nr:DUF5336 domain-containing protein [Mycolicibacterium obuense]KKF00558.1 hypothetical protein WN67_18295 [Mycolicibacterium obuense]OKH68175.1 hypothetical protein EB72_01960 [Mycobacterium sp. SWH-M1]TDL04563.1 hypothetical protein EUA04_22605 [Mycolicibacterium obuense]
MSYPQGPTGGHGYQPGQQPTTQFSAPTQQFARVNEPGPGAEGPSKLPEYLSAATAGLGLLAYLSYFAPQFTVESSDFPGLGELSGSSVGLGIAVVASLVGALVAGVGLLPKQKNRVALAAVASVLGFLLVISEVLNKPSGTSVAWGLWLVTAFTLLQAAVAVVVLLFDSGILTAPTPRPKYEQPQYGQYPGSYYGQPGQQGQPQHGQPQQQRPGYPTPYGGYPGSGPSTGGFPATSPSGQQPSGQQSSGTPSGQQPSGAQSGSPTPPTGYPTYGQPPSSNTPTTQVPTQHPSSPSSQSGQSSS